MSLLFAFDPGLRCSGVALFRDGTLERAGIVRGLEKIRGPEAWNAMGNRTLAWLGRVSLDVFVCERPQVYKHVIGDPDHLIQLAGVDGAVAFACPAPVFHCYVPFQWKRSLGKGEHHGKMMLLLSDAEKARIEPCPESLRHNALDAVALGLFQLGRLER